MPRPKGHPKTGGRREGTPNKKTALVQALGKSLLEEFEEVGFRPGVAWVEAIEAMDYDRANAIKGIFEWVWAKKAPKPDSMAALATDDSLTEEELAGLKIVAVKNG